MPIYPDNAWLRSCACESLLHERFRRPKKSVSADGIKLNSSFVSRVGVERTSTYVGRVDNVLYSSTTIAFSFR